MNKTIHQAEDKKMNKKWLITVAVMYLSLLTLAQAAVQLPGPLVDAAWLKKNLDKVTVLEVRLQPRSYTRQPVYKKDKKTGKRKLAIPGGHIPGSRLVPYKKLRTTVIIRGKKVKKMLPEKAEFEKLMQSVGLNRDAPIVIVSFGANNLDMTMSTRLYWQLKYYGVDNMAILDGGLWAWLKAGGKLAYSPADKEKGNWQATAERREILATTEDVKKALAVKSTQLLDNRPLDLYLGTWKKSYVYARGHIPGAKVWPNTVLTEHGKPAKFLPVETNRKLLEGLGIDPGKPSITYCNSGHLGSGGWFVMHELLGNSQTRLYDGSLHEWTLMGEPVKAFVLE